MINEIHYIYDEMSNVSTTHYEHMERENIDLTKPLWADHVHSPHSHL